MQELLDKAWWDVPAELRPAAAITLAAHLDKLEEEGSLPAGVERPRWGEAVWEDDSWAELSRESPPSEQPPATAEGRSVERQFAATR